jgi:hypothetical protein
MTSKLLFLSVVTAILVSGCAHGVSVSSRPGGASILIDGAGTGEKTPAVLSPKMFPPGRHDVTVELDGYKLPVPFTVRKHVSGGLVFWSIVLPVPFLIINAARGFSVVDMDNKSARDLHFELTPGD